jgi:ATP-dependent DNA helicase RecG
LTLQEALAVPLHSLPRPSRLEEHLSLGKHAREGAAVLGLETVGDLLEHLPRRHADRGDVRPIAALAIDEDGTVEVEVKSITTRPSRNRRMRPRA